MSLSFRKVKRKVTFGKDLGKMKYFAMAKSASLTSLGEVCELVGERSSMSSADVKSVVDSLCWVVDHELRGGRSVQMGELGNFRLSISATPQENEKDLTADTISKARVIFSPGAQLRDTCKKVTFVPLQDIIVEKECDQEHVA